jgi:hypothetical protein
MFLNLHFELRAYGIKSRRMQGGYSRILSAIMEEKIKDYFNRVIHHDTSTTRAQVMLDLIVADYDDICRPLEGNSQVTDLDKALNRFFNIKECKYVRNLLENFIEHGNFKLPSELDDTVHRLDRFKNIKNLLEELLLQGNKVSSL